MAVASRAEKTFKIDVGLLLIVLATLVVGLVMVYSASYGYALVEGGPYQGRPTFFVRRQLIFAFIGLVALVVLSRIDYHIYQRYALGILLGTVGLLLPMALLGRWVLLSGASASVQPSELAKLGAIVYIAIWLAARGDQIRDITLGLVPFALLLGVIAGLILAQPNASTALLLVATAAAMFFVAGADMKQMLIAFLVGGLALGIVVLAAPYRFERIDLWRKGPFSDPSGQGFQVIQALRALNSGGWLGVGLGQSQQKFTIYAAHSDGIFAIIGEEMGFIGGLVVIALYALWTWRGLRIAFHAKDRYGTLLAVGLVAWVSFQAILHIAVLTASAPFTGTVLPFMSAGGSSLITSLAAVGILLNISRGARARAREASA